MKKKTKGFTLIELLAIIVILAIIAVITVPIILDVIDNSKKGAAKDSAYGFKDAVNKYYVSELFNNQNLKLNGDYTITDKGELSDGTNTYPIQVSGTTPTGGTLTYENNVLKNGCITIDEYKATIENGEVTTVEKGSCASSETSNFGGQVITDIPETGHTGVKAIVYLDPTDITTECNAELAATNVNENGSPTGIKSGCMKWYAFKEDDKTYTMLLDHNTTALIPWITQADHEQKGSQTSTPSEVGLTYESEKMTNGLPDGTWGSSGINNRGPITLLNQLKINTSNWDESLKLTDSKPYIAEWLGHNTYSPGNQKYTINYNGYKARILSAEEINELTGKGTNALTNVQRGYLDNNCSSQGTCSAGTNNYGWLFDNIKNCTSYGCNAENNVDPWGYWTMSANASNYSFAWSVVYSGKLDINGVSSASGNGVRPVITVSKSKLGIN